MRLWLKEKKSKVLLIHFPFFSFWLNSKPKIILYISHHLPRPFCSTHQILLLGLKKTKTVHCSLSCLINNKHGQQGLPQTARSVSWFLFCSLINCSTCNKWDSCFNFFLFFFVYSFIYLFYEFVVNILCFSRNGQVR